MTPRFDTIEVIPKGSILNVTQGEYSDYIVLAICKALEDINLNSLVIEYLRIYPEQGVKDYSFKNSQFLAWMINTKKILEEFDNFELHISDYGRSSEGAMWHHKLGAEYD